MGKYKVAWLEMHSKTKDHFDHRTDYYHLVIKKDDETNLSELFKDKTYPIGRTGTKYLGIYQYKADIKMKIKEHKEHIKRYKNILKEWEEKENE